MIPRDHRISNPPVLPPIFYDVDQKPEFFEVNMDDVYQRTLFQFTSQMNIRMTCSKKRTLPAKSEPEPKKPAKEPEIEQHSVVSDKDQSSLPQTVPYEDRYSQLLEEDLPLEVFGVENS